MSKVLTNIELVSFAKTKLGTAYVYGMKGKVMTEANFNYLQNTHNKNGKKNVWDSDVKKVGKVCVDCSGLISWATGEVKSSATFKAESDAQPIKTIASAPVGVAVWLKGHIGIYIGNGEIIEARGSAYGVVKTKVKDRDFTHWFRLLDVDYIEEDDEVVVKDKLIVNDEEFEVNMIRKDGVTYIKTRDVAKAMGLEVSSKGKVPVLKSK